MQQQSYFELFKSFKKFFYPYQGTIILGLFLQTIASSVYLYWTYAFSQVVNEITNFNGDQSLHKIYLFFILMFLSIVIRVVTIYYAKSLFSLGTLKVALDIELAGLDHVNKIDIAWHEKENAGNKVKRIQLGATGVQTLAKTLFLKILDITISLVGCVLILASFDYYIATAVIVYQIIYFLIATTFRRKMVTTKRERNLLDEEYNGLFHEIINNVRTVKVLNMGKGLFESAAKIGRSVLVHDINMAKLGYGSWSSRVTWESLVRISILVNIVQGIISGHYEIGFLVLFWGYFSQISLTTNDLSDFAQDLALARTSASRLSTLFDIPTEHDKDNEKRKFPSEWSVAKLKDLSFAYGENKALHKIDFDIKRGEKIGIVGLSGAGKSTLFKILLKEHSATEGDVYFDDTALTSIRKSDYLRHVAPVLQETEVFNMSLKRNIALANIHEEQNDALLNRAITTSHVSDFLHKLPQGVDTVIGEKGVKLSGGERQRVGIARAIFKDPQILLLDEATSHLDVESEQKIQDSLHQFFKGITAIVIAHRLSTIKEMDRIIVIENGTIIEQGTFDELHAKDARFREFWDKQSQV